VPVPEPAPELERALFNSRPLSHAGLIAKGKAPVAFWAAQADAVATADVARVVVDPLPLRDSFICPQDGDHVNPGDEFTAFWSDEPSSDDWIDYHPAPPGYCNDVGFQRFYPT
jgi:hypothetical protein